MESMAKIMNTTPSASINIPTTKHEIKKMIQPLFKHEFYIKCSQCVNYLVSATSSVNCCQCKVLNKCIDSDYFIYVPIKDQLLHTLNRNFDTIISYAKSVVEHETISDIHCAEIYKNVQNRYPNSTLLPLIVNTDGAKVYKTNHKSLWMIQVAQAFLPPSTRYLTKNILIVAAHFGFKKPKMTSFFRPFLNDLKQINESDGLIYHSKNGQTFNFMPIIIACSCDLPAKSELQGTIGHSGRFGCTYCEHPGISVKPEAKRKAVTRFINVQTKYKTRTHKDVVDIYTRLKSEPIKGIKNVSCMIVATNFDLVDGFAIDAMHCVHLGVMRKLLSLWLDSEYKNQPFHINTKNQVTLSNRLISIKPITEIMRKPRSIFNKGEFKANEFRSLLFHFLPFALSGLLERQYITHFHLLSYSIYTLSKKCISIEDVKQAQLQLSEFVNDFQKLYGKSNVTMNVHLLNHLATSVSKLGPLWATSVYGFETNNGVVIRANTSKKDMAHQLIYKYIMKQTLAIDEQKKDALVLNGKTTIKISTAEKQICEKSGFQINDNNFLNIYKCIVIQGIKFTSEKSKEMTTLDHFVRLKNGLIGSVNFYSVFDMNLYALITIYITTDQYGHFMKIEKSDRKQLIRINEILEKLLYLRFGLNEFITIPPNMYEKM